MPLLEVKDPLRFKYRPKDSFELCAPALRIEEGKVYALFGRSSYGKSTLLKLMAGLLPTPCISRDAGLCENGAMSYVPQHDNLLPWLSVASNISLPLQVAKIRARYGDDEDTGEIVRRMCKLYELDPNARPRNISGGARRRVSFLRAIMARPRIILMDEPFAGLDEGNRDLLIKLLCNEVDDRKTAIVWVTHELSDVALLADEVLFFVAKGTVDANPLKFDRVNRANGLDRYSEGSMEMCRQIRDRLRTQGETK